MNRNAESRKRAALTRLAAELACGTEARWRTALSDSASVASGTEIEEVLLQSHLFVGFPVVLNAFIVWRERSPGRGQLAEEQEVEGREARCAAGELLCARVYGKAYDRLRVNVRELSLDLDRWMIEDGYGKTLSRPGLEIVTRELCIVALLAAAGHTRQLRSHLRGALNVGATVEAVERAINTGCDVARETRMSKRPDPDAVLVEWRDIRERIGT